jgi:hypothetical protein
VAPGPVARSTGEIASAWMPVSERPDTV